MADAFLFGTWSYFRQEAKMEVSGHIEPSCMGLDFRVWDG